MRVILRHDDGLSVIELLVALGLLLVLLVAGLSVFDSGVRTEAGQRVRAEVLDDMRHAQSFITKDLRQALSVDTASTPSALEMTTLFDGGERTVVYDVVDGVLRRKIDGGTPTPLVRGVVELDVFCFDPPGCTASHPATDQPALVRVHLKVQPRLGAAAIELSTDVQLRNTVA